MTRQIEFFYELTGLIDDEFVVIQTDSKKVIKKIANLMQDGKK